jgi:CDP-glucose 4,6-dehydratase
MGTANLLEACRMHAKYVHRIIVASSDKAYGDLCGDSYDESFPLKGQHPYDVSKSCADLISQMYFKTYGLPVAITRCGNFFGAGDLNISRLVPGTIQDVLDGKAPVIRSNGKFIRDYLFVEDGVHAYVTLAEAMDGKRFGGEAFNFSYGLRLTALEVVDKILTAMERRDLKPVITNHASNEIPVQCLDSTKAREQLYWRPLFGFDQGLEKTIEWYRAQYPSETRMSA